MDAVLANIGPMQTKTDDLFPYADRQHSYWTGTAAQGSEPLYVEESSILQNMLLKSLYYLSYLFFAQDTSPLDRL